MSSLITLIIGCVIFYFSPDVLSFPIGFITGIIFAINIIENKSKDNIRLSRSGARLTSSGDNPPPPRD